jgi:hypothetical protein
MSWQSFTKHWNSAGHERGLALFLVVVLAHWAEHLVQAVQIYALGWPVPEARGVLGLWFPWLVSSELLHYGYALVMLVGIALLRSGFRGRAYRWWMLAFWIQVWHHAEHALLLGQAVFDQPLFGRPVPTSLIQLVIPRVELHLLYNTIVFLPMVVAMALHKFPSPEERARHSCPCAVEAGALASGAL